MVIYRKGDPRGDPGYVPNLAIGDGTIMQSSELLDYELKQGELLDARIARKIKSCFELKAMEEMRSKT